MKKMFVICLSMAMVLLFSGCDASAIAENEMVQAVGENVLEGVRDYILSTQDIEEAEEYTGHTDTYLCTVDSIGPNGESFHFEYRIKLQYKNADGSDGVNVGLEGFVSNGELWGSYDSPSDFGSECRITIYEHSATEGLITTSGGTVDWIILSGDTLTASVTYVGTNIREYTLEKST